MSFKPSFGQIAITYIGKRCYAQPLFRDWTLSRKIKAVRLLQNKAADGGHWEVKLRNWFWHEWIRLEYVEIVTEIYD